MKRYQIQYHQISKILQQGGEVLQQGGHIFDIEKWD
jgi:hypothetical protein